MPHKENSADRTDHYVSSDELRIGMYVFVDLPWFLHPFTLNSFRVSSEAQIAELRSLKLRHYRYDPERSDSANGAILSTPPAAQIGLPTEAPVPGAASADPVRTEKEERALHLSAHRRAVAQTEKAFIKATGIVRRLSKNLLKSPKESIEDINGLVEQMASVFLERPDVSLHVMGEKCGGEEAYFHGLNVSILSLMLAKGLDLNQEQARILGVGALLHDIGQMEIPDRVLKKSPDEQTRPERELYASHVEYGVRIGKQVALQTAALEIIAQHHELADGSGYPSKLALEQIAPLARVVSLVNYYDNLCNPVAIHQAMTPHEALSFIFARRKDKFDARILQLMIRYLGVYPPGSIVKLSNEAIASVISVNPQKALRPWVLLYDAGVPKDQAVMLDLDRETGVSIVKSMRPALLPPAVSAYLSPRKRISYFFDSDAPTEAKRNAAERE
jgi:putative nucleotidyltransferase with HDIG domain